MNDLFIITSVIHVDTKSGWTYWPIKSEYTAEERFADTLKTIQSIREKCPGADIALLEGNALMQEEETQFKSQVEYYRNYSNHEDTVAKVNSVKKGWGEVAKLFVFMQELESIGKYRRIFKISGRYWLNDHFQPEKFSMNLPSFRKNSQTSFSTVLYSIPAPFFAQYKFSLLEINKLIENNFTGIENMFFPFFQPFYSVDFLGVSGRVAVKKGFTYEF